MRIVLQRMEETSKTRAGRERRRAPRPSRRAAVLAPLAALVALTGAARCGAALYVVGDSWAAGRYADPRRALAQVAAARLRWRVEVDALSGTGYVNGAATGTSYVDRLARLAPRPHVDVVVVQGGSNDRSQPADRFEAAVAETIDLLRSRFPNARPVLLGPGPDPLPVTEDQLAVDRRLARLAAARAVPYVSMLREGWIADDDRHRVLDRGNHHPTVRGQAYLGRRLERTLRRLFPSLVV
jgi:lysophospholipase L1-like esterase